MIDAPHTLDLSRLRHLDGVKRGYLAQAQGYMKQIEDLRRQEDELDRHREHAVRSLEEASRAGFSTVTEGGALVHRYRSVQVDKSPIEHQPGLPRGGRKVWQDKIDDLDRKIADLRDQRREVEAAKDAVFEKFTVTDRLIKACEAYVGREEHDHVA